MTLATGVSTGLKTDWVRYGAAGHLGYFCFPERAATPLPAVVVLQEAWGVDAHIQDVARRFAKAGYAALAPDLYARDGERPGALGTERLAELLAFLNTTPAAFLDAAVREAHLAEKTGAERERIVESHGAVVAVGDLSPFLPAALEATRWLRDECGATRRQRVGSVGFCMGGGLSGLLACHDPNLAAAVAFYGSPPPLDQVPRIGCPVLWFYGTLDARIRPQMPAFEEAMKRAGKRFEPFVYDGAQHAFFNDRRPNYDVAASRDAFQRTLAFFRAELAR